jgi:hypothetical protein
MHARRREHDRGECTEGPVFPPDASRATTKRPDAWPESPRIAKRGSGSAGPGPEGGEGRRAIALGERLDSIGGFARFCIAALARLGPFGALKRPSTKNFLLFRCHSMRV